MDIDLEPWSQRLDPVASTLVYHQPSFISLQEVWYHQIIDILGKFSEMPSGFGDDGGIAKWDFVGVSATDGGKFGSFSPILYDTARYQLKMASNFWLSETPLFPSIGWDAQFPRACVVAQFSPVEMPDFNFTILNTHLDHVGEEARVNSVSLILEQMEQISGPVFLMGDFNAGPGDAAYQAIVDSERFVDAAEAAAVSVGNFESKSSSKKKTKTKKKTKGGKTVTTTESESEESSSESEESISATADLIDHIFVDKTTFKLKAVGNGEEEEEEGGGEEEEGPKVHVDVYAVENNCNCDGVHLSDHRPLIVDISL